MKRKEKVIGSLVIATVAILFLFIGYSKTNNKKLSDSDLEKLFLSSDESKEDKELEFVSGLESNSKKGDIEKENLEKEDNIEDYKETKEAKEKIVVEIKGEVKKPNVYRLSYGSRIYELIEEAGGVTDEADLSKINRALYLNDGQCVVIENINDPKGEEANLNEDLNSEASSKPSSNLSSEGNSKGENSIININKASKETLMTLNGIGDSKAQAIIDYREESGGFKSVEDIKNVSGIGEKTLDKIKDKISIN